MQRDKGKNRIISFVSCPDEGDSLKKFNQQGQVSSRYKLDPARKKLPRPIMFWSVGEKDAYRRNRAIQAELNKNLAHISWQNKLSGRKVRSEARQFRDRISNFWPDPAVVIFGSGYPIIEHPAETSGKKKQDNLRSKSATCLRFTGQMVKSAHSVAIPSSHDDGSISDSEETVDGIMAKLQKLPEVTQNNIASIRTTLKANGLLRSRAKSETDLTEIRDACEALEGNEFSEVNQLTSPANIRRPKRSCFSRMDSFMFDRIKEAYHLKLELKNSARERRLNPSKKQLKKQEILAGEKENYTLCKEKVKTYLSKLDLYLGCEPVD